jgi:hypothetical protein
MLVLGIILLAVACFMFGMSYGIYTSAYPTSEELDDMYSEYMASGPYHQCVECGDYTPSPDIFGQCIDCNTHYCNQIGY